MRVAGDKAKPCLNHGSCSAIVTQRVEAARDLASVGAPTADTLSARPDPLSC